MQCEICLTLEHQLRSYEMDIQIRLTGSDRPPADRAKIEEGSLGEAREGYQKTKALYRRHREKDHNVHSLS
jgi:hypothetical protein